MNVIADDLSRGGQILPTEWSLHQDIADLIFRQWGYPNLDLFATWFNTKCATFVSLTPDHRAIFPDAQAMSWEGIFAYAFPSQQILIQVLQKFNQTKQSLLILVAPFWPKQAWFADLQRLTGEKPIPFPPWDKMLKQPTSDVYHHKPRMFNLHAWKLSRPL